MGTPTMSVFLEPINEGSTCRLSGILKDENGVVIPAVSIAALKVWVSAEATPTSYINSRNAQDIKNVNGGSIGATDGVFALRLSAADNVLVNPALAYERHLVLIEWTYNGGADKGRQEIVLTIRNLAQV